MTAEVESSTLPENFKKPLNLFEKARIDYEANLIAILGSGAITRREVPEHLKDEYDEINRESIGRRYWEVSTELNLISYTFHNPDSNSHLTRHQALRVYSIADTLKSHLRGQGTTRPQAIFEDVAKAKADLYRIDNGLFSEDDRPTISGRLDAFEWILGRRESLDLLA